MAETGFAIAMYRYIYIYVRLQINKEEVSITYLLSWYQNAQRARIRWISAVIIFLFIFRKAEFPIDVDMTILWDGRRPVRVTSL